MRWIGLVHDPTRATALDQSSKSGDSSRAMTCAATRGEARSRSSAASSPNPAKGSGLVAAAAMTVMGQATCDPSRLRGLRGVRGFLGFAAASGVGSGAGEGGA